MAYGEEFLKRLEGPTIVIGDAMIGSSLFWLGELEQALDHLQRSASLYTPEEHRPLTFIYGHEPGMYAEVYLSWTCWLLGYPDRALAHTLKFLRLGLEVQQAQSQAFALTCAATSYQMLGDTQRVRELAEEAITFSSEQGLPMWLLFGIMQRGWARAEQGEVSEGIAELRQAIDDFLSSGTRVAVTIDLCRLAEEYWKTGQFDEGLAVVAETQALIEEGEERCQESFLYQVKGELLLGAGRDASEAEASFHKAIEVARRQGAKSLELRAETSLARLLIKQGKRDEARKRLTEIYSWFTEGFETSGLKDPMLLIEELS
jgi:adenylate cyclase